MPRTFFVTQIFFECYKHKNINCFLTSGRVVLSVVMLVNLEHKVTWSSHGAHFFRVTFLVKFIFSQCLYDTEISRAI